MCIYRQIYQTKRAIILRGLKRWNCVVTKHNISLLYRWTWCPQIDFKSNKPNGSTNSFANLMFQRRYFVACDIPFYSCSGSTKHI